MTTADLRDTTAPLGEAISGAVGHLVPSARCTVRAGHEGVPGRGPAGVAPGEQGLVCWGAADGVRWQAVISRDAVPLTSVEVELLGELPDAVQRLGPVGRTSGPVSAATVLEEVLVARLLGRRADDAFDDAATGTILAAIRQLSLRRYEGRAATSGVLAVGRPAAWTAAVDADPHLAADPFAEPLPFDQAFFDRPASHRYVDGRHSVYVVGPDLAVRGLVRLLGYRRPDDQDVALGGHLRRLLAATSPSWCATVDRRSTVDVHGGPHLHVRWRSYHWRLLDRRLVVDQLLAAGMAPEDATTLAGTLLALSDARQGALVLVPTGRRTPGIAGMIDSSPAGAALLSHLVGRGIAALRAEGTLMGILSCDGLSVVSAEGELLVTGAIIELADGAGGRSGGGRTRAAATASRCGLVAMVSSDGQVSLHRDGEVVLHLER